MRLEVMQTGCYEPEQIPMRIMNEKTGSKVEACAAMCLALRMIEKAKALRISTEKGPYFPSQNTVRQQQANSVKIYVTSTGLKTADYNSSSATEL
jgi:hypothetical protein